MSMLRASNVKMMIEDIIREESTKENIKVKVFPVTVLEYYNSDFFKTQVKKQKKNKVLKIELSSIPFYASGFHYPQDNDDSLSNIVVFLNKKKLIFGKDGLFSLINITYHELRHAMQEQCQNLYEAFIYALESVNQATSYGKYLWQHDNYLMEADANLYAIKKVEEYFQRYGMLTEDKMKLVETLRAKYQYQYDSYDPQITMDQFNDIPQSMFKKLNYKGSWLPIVYNEDGTMKPASDILDSPEFKKFDKKIQYTIISSRKFIASLNNLLNPGFESLSEENKRLVLEALIYTYESHLKRVKMTYEYLHSPYVINNEKINITNLINTSSIRMNALAALQKKRSQEKHMNLDKFYTNLPEYISDLEEILSNSNCHKQDKH